MYTLGWHTLYSPLMLDEFYFQDSEDLTVEVVLNICSFHDSRCQEINCRILDDRQPDKKSRCGTTTLEHIFARHDAFWDVLGRSTLILLTGIPSSRCTQAKISASWTPRSDVACFSFKAEGRQVMVWMEMVLGKNSGWTRYLESPIAKFNINISEAYYRAF